MSALAELRKLEAELRKVQRYSAVAEAMRRTAGTAMAARRSEKTGRTRRAHLDALVAEMHAAYHAGASLAECGRRFGRDRRSVRELFATRGLPIRSTAYIAARLANGQIAPARLLTPEKITALIEQATAVKIPPEVRREWRLWSLARRGEFVQRLRAKLKTPGQPETPFAGGVEPFDYASEHAWRILREANRGVAFQEVGGAPFPH